jgi:O-antigen/teichoic acid export membrane protein
VSIRSPRESASSPEDAREPRPRLSLTQRIAWNAGSQVAGRIAALAVGLVTTILVTHHLGVRGFGNLTAVTVYISLFSVFFDWGIPTVLVRDLSRGLARPADLIGRALALRLGLAVVVAAVAGVLALPIYSGGTKDQIRNGILLALPMIVFGSAASTVATLFQAQLKMARLAAAELASQIVTVFLIVLAVASDRGLYAIIGAVVVGNGVYALSVVALFARIAPIRLRVDVELWGRLFRRALPVGIALVLNTIYFRLDAFLLSLLKGSRDIGIYGIAFRFSEMLTPFALFAAASVFPVLTATVSSGERPQLLRALQRTFDVILVAAVPVVLGTIAIAPQIVSFLAPASFAPATTPLRIVIVGTGLTFLSTFLAFVVIAHDRQRDALWLNAVALLFNLALNLALIPPFGYLAAAWVATASEVVIFAGLIYLTYRFVGFLPSPAVAWKALLAGGAMFAVVFLFHPNLLIAVALGAAVYATAVFLLRIPRAIGLSELVARGGA